MASIWHSPRRTPAEWRLLGVENRRDRPDALDNRASAAPPTMRCRREHGGTLVRTPISQTRREQGADNQGRNDRHDDPPPQSAWRRDPMAVRRSIHDLDASYSHTIARIETEAEIIWRRRGQGSLKKASSFSPSSRCAVDDTGRNSVRPWTMPRIAAEMRRVPRTVNTELMSRTERLRRPAVRSLDAGYDARARAATESSRRREWHNRRRYRRRQLRRRLAGARTVTIAARDEHA